MKVRLHYFNIILFAALLAGCETADSKKEVTALRLFLEVPANASGESHPVPVYRAAPVMINVEASPFIDERDIENAAVVDSQEGFFIQLQFNRHGTWTLENVTRGNPNRHLAILADFGESRWLAAPFMAHAIGTGQLTFTPDATRAEADRIVRGLNTVAAEGKNQYQY